MLKGFIIGIVVAAVVAALAGFAIVYAGVIPANADDKPPSFERWAARRSLHATLAHAPNVTNPLTQNDANLIAGVKLYAQNCAICHGDSNGNPTAVAKGLYQKPPQLGKDGVEDDPDWVTYWKVYHGIRWTGMPAFGHTLSQEQVWQLTMFLKNMDRLPPAAQEAWNRVKT